MNNDDLTKIVDFLHEARKLQLTYRNTPKPNGGYENDAEHSWSVSIICMLLSSMLEEEFKVKLDTLKMLKMCLIHDMAEIKTGDTKTWDTAARVNKDENERLAINELVSLLPKTLGDEFLQIWEECEARETLEAKIVKSIDRFDPVMHRVFFEIGWDDVEKDHAPVEALDSRQLPRHEFSKILTEIYKLVREEALRKNLIQTINS